MKQDPRKGALAQGRRFHGLVRSVKASPKKSRVKSLARFAADHPDTAYGRAADAILRDLEAERGLDDLLTYFDDPAEPDAALQALPK